jgi:ribulose-5-phosphate 4-epimerase/fuculose-1-phosphate aldolase
MTRYFTIRKQVIDCCQWLCSHGYFGSYLSAGGNVSVKIPDERRLVITPSGKPYMDLAPSDICIVDFDLNLVDGNHGPSMETGMHIGIYENRPDVGAVVHTHQTYASIFSLLNLAIPPLFDEVVMGIGDRVDVIPYALSGSSQLAENVKQAVSNGCNCYTMQNHGALNLGDTLETAWKNAELLEKTAQVYHCALCTGRSITTLPKKSLKALSK